MKLVKWNKDFPFPSIFDDDDFWSFSPVNFNAQDSGLNMYETDDTVVVEASVPGVPEDEVNVSIEGNILTISADFEETDEEKEKKKVVYKSSRRSSFRYSTNLPRMVVGSEAEAEVENGVVKVTIPKSEEEKPKRIEVRKKS